MIERTRYADRVHKEFAVHPVVALTGPRQCGKTTLARAIASDNRGSTLFDLEAARDRRRLETPERTLEDLAWLVVIDEIQRTPALFETLRVLVDRADNRTRFLVLGSASPTLVRGVSESLAGRVGLVDLAGFDLSEVGPERWRTLWLRGGFPRAYLATDDRVSARWRRSFSRTFLERDIPQLGITVPAETLGRFWTMTAHYHGQVWNAAEFARALGANEGTARRYLDILTGSLGPRTAGRNSTCSSLTAAGATGSNANSPMPRARHVSCASPCRTWDSRTCGSSTRGPRRIHWTTPFPCCRSATSQPSPGPSSSPNIPTASERRGIRWGLRLGGQDHSGAKRWRLSSRPRPELPSTLPFSTITSPRDSVCVGQPVTSKPSYSS